MTQEHQHITEIQIPQSNIDIRIRQLSYSSLLTLHSCPRKYQLYKLRGKEEDTDGFSDDNITFSFGHVIGEGVQLLFEGKTLEQTIWKMFNTWHADLLAENPKQAKSFFFAVTAIQKFYSLCKDNNFLADYELVYWNGKPATELGFSITTPDGFKFRGFVDAVLRHKKTEEITVLEVKTTSSTNISAAQYKNSSQALGYSVVLDVIFPQLSSYKVLYLPYQSKSREWSVLPFVKSLLQRAQWIQEFILDIETIKLYEATGVYPMRGESCYDYYRECEYFGLCTLNTSSLVKQLEQSTIDKLEKEVFSVELTLADLITAQMDK